MITREATAEDITKWKAKFEKHKNALCPNRKTGAELLSYFLDRYAAREIFTADALAVVSENVLQNACFKEKLPEGAQPKPRAFLIEDAGEIARLRADDPSELWEDIPDSIFVGIDLVTGYFTVEGSTLLWDELCAYLGLDESDLGNFVIVAEYVESLQRFGLLQDTIKE